MPASFFFLIGEEDDQIALEHQPTHHPIFDSSNCATQKKSLTVPIVQPKKQ
jgi:hypothetical protein